MRVFLAFLGCHLFLKGINPCFGARRTIPTVTVTEDVCERGLLTTSSLGEVSMIRIDYGRSMSTLNIGVLDQISDRHGILVRTGYQGTGNDDDHVSEYALIDLNTGRILRFSNIYTKYSSEGLIGFTHQDKTIYDRDRIYMIEADGSIHAFRFDVEGRSDEDGYYLDTELKTGDPDDRLWGVQNGHASIQRSIAVMTYGGPRIFEARSDSLDLSSQKYPLPEDVDFRGTCGELVFSEDGSWLFTRVDRTGFPKTHTPLLWNVDTGSFVSVFDSMRRDSVFLTKIYEYYALGSGFLLQTDMKNFGASSDRNGIYWFDLATLRSHSVGQLPDLRFQTPISIQRHRYDDARLAALLPSESYSHVFLLDVDTGRVHRTLDFKTPVVNVALFQERPYGLALLRNGFLVLFDVRTGEQVEMLDIGLGEADRSFFGQIRISPDGQTILMTSGFQRSVRILRLNR